MKTFRLKKEVKPLFKGRYNDAIWSLDKWKEKGIPFEILEETPRVFILEGISTSKNTKTISGWSGAEQMSRFDFTLCIMDCDNNKYQLIKKNDELINRLEEAVIEAADRFINMIEL